MPAKCDRCDKPSYVKYVKLNRGIICDKCEDAERNYNGAHNIWETIKINNRRWHTYHYQNTLGIPPS